MDKKRYILSFFSSCIVHLLIFLIFIIAHRTENSMKNVFLEFQLVEIDKQTFTSKPKFSEKLFSGSKVTAKEKDRKLSSVDSAKKIISLENSEDEKNTLDEAIIASDSSKNLNAYIENIYRKIDANKFYPKLDLKKKYEDFVSLEFIVDKNGVVSRIKITRKSNLKKLNNAALDAVLKAMPFDKMPDSMPNEIQIKINLYFQPK